MSNEMVTLALKHSDISTNVTLAHMSRPVHRLEIGQMENFNQIRKIRCLDDLPGTYKLPHMCYYLEIEPVIKM